MIKITVYRKSGVITGFRCNGHAGYADEGYDIICSAVSALTVNAVNSIEQFTDDAMTVSADDGLVEMHLDESISNESKLLLDSMVLGLQAIQDNYGNEYIDLIIKEV